MRFVVPRASSPLCLTVLFLSGCGADEGTNPPPDPPSDPTGHIEVSLSVDGFPPDPDGVRVILNGRAGVVLGNGESHVFTDLTPGRHSVHIDGVAWHCGLADESTRVVEVRVDQTSQVAIAVECRNIGALTVRTSTAGSAVDPDGYTLELEGHGAVSVSDATTAIWPELEAGPYRVNLLGLADHCWIPGGRALTVDVIAAESTHVSFGVACPPFHDHIAFGSEGDLWVMRSNGTGLVNLTPGAFGGTDPSWSPDATRIAFKGGPPDYGIWVMETDGSETQRISDGRSPQWSPDGQLILWVDGWDGTYVMDADGSNLTHVIGAYCESPQWSPDGLQIAFTSGQDCGGGDPAFHKSIYVASLDGSGKRRVTSGVSTQLYDTEPAWFPGTRIAFVGWAEGWASADIYSIAPDGSELLQLTHSRPGELAYEPQWSPDGEWVVFSHNPGQGSRQICVVGADGSGYHCLTRGTSYHGYPSWSPGP